MNRTGTIQMDLLGSYDVVEFTLLHQTILSLGFIKYGTDDHSCFSVFRWIEIGKYIFVWHIW